MGAFIISIVCYLLGLSSLVVFFSFIQFFVDRNPLPFSWASIVWNACVFLVFPLQHSILARPGIKDRIRHFTGEKLERPLYVGTSGVAMYAVLWLWKPVGPILYQLPYALSFDVVTYFALLLLIVTTVQMGHASMFGLAHGHAALKGLPLPQNGMKTDGMFGLVRHPLTLLLLVVLWSHNTLTAGRLEFNLLFSAYALIGTVFEENDLVKHFGDAYLEYRKRVPAFIPFLRW